MVDEKKKKKLTLTASPKKPVNVPPYIQDRKKTSVIVEKRVPKGRNERNFITEMIILKKPLRIHIQNLKHLRIQIHKKQHQIEVLKLEKLQKSVQRGDLKI